MQAIMETIFDIGYLVVIIIMGYQLLTKYKKNDQSQLFGCMALVLGIGDAFHLLPRVYSLWTNSMDANAAALGFGKLVTSITMTVFYVLLYHVWCKHFKVTKKAGWTAILYALALVRIALCFFPQNQWFVADSPLSWGIYRNIPFALMGAIMVWLFWDQAHQSKNSTFHSAWLAISLSFLFYIPVVLWADSIPLMGMLMLPKTVCYVWLVYMGYKNFRA